MSRGAHESALDCSLCLSIPSGIVHQCSRGHHFCAECLADHMSSGNPHAHVCPMCRVALPSEPIRAYMLEHAIEQLPSACSFCGLGLERGKQSLHEQSCPRRRVTCSAASARCPWEGTASELAEHEASCSYIVCTRVVERYTVEWAEERSTIQRHIQFVESVQEMLVLALRGLMGLVGTERPDCLPQLVSTLRSVEPQTATQAAAALGCFTTPQFAALIPADAVAGLIDDTVESMKLYPTLAAVQEQSCRVTAILMRLGHTAAKQRAASAGALEAITAGMMVHLHLLTVQQHGCLAIRRITKGLDSDAVSRKQHAVNAGALDALVAATSAHKNSPLLQQLACSAIASIVVGKDIAASTRRARADRAGCIDAIIRCMADHRSALAVQQEGSLALSFIARGVDDEALVRRRSASEAGMIETVADAMHAHLADERVQDNGCKAMANVTYGMDVEAAARRHRAVSAGVLGCVIHRMMTHRSDAAVQELGCRAIAHLAVGAELEDATHKDHCVNANAVEAVVQAMRDHWQVHAVQEQGCVALAVITGGHDVQAECRQQRASNAGAVEAIVAGMQAHPQSSVVQVQAFAAILQISTGASAMAEGRARHALSVGALDAIAASMAAHEASPKTFAVLQHGLRTMCIESQTWRQALSSAGSHIASYVSG